MDKIYFLPGSDILIAPASLRDVMSLHELEKKCFQLDAWPLLDIV
jgi:hypothetical protein